MYPKLTMIGGYFIKKVTASEISAVPLTDLSMTSSAVILIEIDITLMRW